MKTSSIVIGIIVLVLLIGGWMAAGYNGLITSRENVSTQWAQVETQYQRRFDLVPNLVATVKGAAAFEQETFTAVTQARSRWQGAATRGDQIQAAESFDSALSRLLVTVEAYPQLKATQAFQDLMVELSGTENRIATARRDFNGSVQEYNLRVKRFPGSILAGIFGFEEEPFFEATEGSETAPTVEF